MQVVIVNADEARRAVPFPDDDLVWRGQALRQNQFSGNVEPLVIALCAPTGVDDLSFKLGRGREAVGNAVDLEVLGGRNPQPGADRIADVAVMLVFLNFDIPGTQRPGDVLHRLAFLGRAGHPLVFGDRRDVLPEPIRRNLFEQALLEDGLPDSCDHRGLLTSRARGPFAHGTTRRAVHGPWGAPGHRRRSRPGALRQSLSVRRRAR